MLTACKQYCIAAGATQGNIACTQTVVAMLDLLAAKKITTENNDIFRVTIKYKRIKSYHFVLTVSNHNRILTYQIVSNGE